MTNEIKEIIENLKNFSIDYPYEDVEGDIKKLLDYITNLHDRIDKAIDYIEEETRYSNLLGTVEFYGDTYYIIDIIKGEENEKV